MITSVSSDIAELWGSISGNTGSDKSLELKDMWMLRRVVRWVNMDLSADLLTSKTENIDLHVQCWSSVCLHTAEFCRGPIRVSHVPKHSLRRTVVAEQAGEIFRMLTTLPGTFLLPPQNSVTPEWKNKCYFTEQSKKVDVPISSLFHPPFAKPNTNLGKGRYFMKLCGLT